MLSLVALRTVLFTLALGLMLSSCALFSRNSFPEQTSKSLERIEPALDSKNFSIEDQWWQAFGDEQLNLLISQGLAQSTSLDIAAAKIASTKSMLEAERANFLPQVAISGAVDRQQLSTNYIFLPGMPVYTGYGNVNASLSWSLDIWGKQKKYFDAAKNQMKSAQASYMASRLLISTTIARVYIDYDRMTRSRNFYARDFEVRKILYRIAQERLRAGMTDVVLLNQRKLEMDNADVNMKQADLSIRMVQHQIAALVQEGPTWGESLKDPSLKTSALNLPEKIPSNLLERRPDLQALLSQINAAKLQLEGAKLEYLPDINLTGFAGFQSFGLSQLFSSNSSQFSIGPLINLPIFDGGSIAANITGKEAGRNVAVANYQEQLLQALRDVADGIASVKSTQANFISNQTAYQSAKSNFDISKRRNEVGIISKEGVINSEESSLTQGQALADAKAKMLTANVILVQALGGSYLESSRQLNDPASAK